jgi:hypothetical protein
VLLLNSCSKNATLEDVTPSAVEATSEIKEWATKNDKLNQVNLIQWDYSSQIILSENIKGFSAPLKSSSSDLTEFITFELEGKRHGWYKSYKRLNETDMEIIILSIEGETLRSGFLRKIKTSIPKGKAVTMREMNLSQS